MIKTRLTEFLNIEHPIISAPMAFAAGGELANAVSRAGGMGLIGGGYGDEEWISTQFNLRSNHAIGCGMITWALAEKPEMLDLILSHNPAAMFLSFADPAPFSAQIKSAGVPLICQVQSLYDTKLAVDAGADIIVAQGAEAGGHGDSRGTLCLVPEVADYLSRNAPEVILCAAGGIGDGRGLAAALMLGAEGVLIGSRFWASTEAMVHKNMHQAAIEKTGDDTIRSSVMDIARHIKWPARFTARVLKNGFTQRWHHDQADLIKNADTEADKWKKAWNEGNVDIANTFVGEVTGLIHDIQPAEVILKNIMDEAEKILTIQRVS